MKIKLSKTLLIILSLGLISCSKKMNNLGGKMPQNQKEKQNEKKNKNEKTTSKLTTSINSNELLLKIESQLKDLRFKKISSQNEYSQLGANILKLMSFTIDKSERSDLSKYANLFQSKLNTVQNINLELLDIHKFSLSKQLKALNLIYQLNLNLENIDGLNDKNKILSFFDLLNQEHSDLPLNHFKLSIILNYVSSLKNIYFQKSSELNNALEEETVLNFLKTQISLANTKISNRNILIIHIAQLAELYKRPKNIFFIVSKIIGDLQIRDNASDNEFLLYQKAINYLSRLSYEEVNKLNIDLNKKQILNIINNFKKNIKWNISHASLQDIDSLVNAMKNIGNFLYFFDNFLAYNHRIDHRRYIRYMDERFYKLELPLIDLFHRISDKNLTRFQTLDLNTFHPIIHNNFLQILKNVKLEEIKADDLNKNAHKQDVVDKSESKHNSKAKYNKGLSEILFLKSMLKLQNKNLNDTNDFFQKQTIVKNIRANNLSLLKIFLETLSLRDSSKKRKISLDQAKLNLELLSSKFHQSSFMNICDLYKTASANGVDGPCKEEILMPGIHARDSRDPNNMNISYEHIIGHPLSMLYSKGKTIDLSVNSLSNIWINTSNSEIKKQEFDMSYLFMGALPIQNKSRSPLKPRWVKYVWSVTAGKAPQTANDGISGNNGGDVNFIGLQNFNNLLITANGEKGRRGQEGISSPLCNSKKEYRAWKGKTATLEYADYDERHHESYFPAVSHNVSGGKGGNGGVGGNGGNLTIVSSMNLDNNQGLGHSFISLYGQGGDGGKIPSCNAPMNEQQKLKLLGQKGTRGEVGKIIVE